MLKKVIVGTLVVVLIGALGVGILDAAQGKSLAAQAVVQPAAQTATTGQAGIHTPGTGLTDPATGTTGTQTQGQGQGYRGGQGNTTNGQGGQGTTTNPNPGTPQANVTAYETLTGVVQNFDGVGISLTTTDGAAVWVQFGQSRYVSAQGVTFNVGDNVTVTGFYENGQFQASTVVNTTTGQTLTLRDASGRPLWAGGGNGNH